MGNRLSWFHTRPVGPQIWAIDDGDEDLIYLIAGRERALLLDTGWGIGDLKGVVASFTSLPLLVLNSHGHPDHASGNGAFDRVHIARPDLPFVKTPLPAQEVAGIREELLSESLTPDVSLDAWSPGVAGELVPVEDGHIFDLGGRTLEVIALPGHTPGSICLLDRQARALFVGDSIHDGVIWLHLEESLPLGEFCRGLRRLQGWADAFDYILPGHTDLDALPLPKEALPDLIAGIEQVLSGQRVGRPEHTFAGDGLRCDFALSSLLYHPDRL